MNLSLEKRPAFGCSGHLWSPLDSTRAGCASPFRIGGPGMEPAGRNQTSASPARMESRRGVLSYCPQQQRPGSSPANGAHGQEPCVTGTRCDCRAKPGHGLIPVMKITHPMPPSCPRLVQEAERKAGVWDLELTTSHRVPGSIPEQAISCAGREGNGQSMATTCKCSKGERQPDSVPVGAKGVTAGETAPLSTRTRPAIASVGKNVTSAKRVVITPGFSL